MRIGFDKIDESIKIYDGIKYLVLFDPERFDATYDRISCKILKAKKVVLHIVLVIILQKLELIHVILYL